MNGFPGPSFFSYEGLRILISGLFAYGLIRAAAPAFLADDALVELADASTVAVIALASGLMLYFVDLPSFTPLVKTQPAMARIRDIGRAANLGPYVAENRFYIAFDTLFPPTLRDRGSYFLEIYRIGFEAILLTSVGATVLWLQLGVEEPKRVKLPLVFLVIMVATLVGWFSIAVPATWIKAGRSNQAYWVGLRRNLGWWGVISILLAIGGAIIYQLYSYSSLVVLGSLTCLVVWIYRLVRGVPLPDEDNRNQLWPEISLLFMGTAVGTSCSMGVVFQRWWFEPRPEPLSQLWLALTIGVGALIAFRSHEKRFLATSHEQREWLELNDYEVRRRLDFPRSSD